MTSKNPQIYKLLHDAELFEKEPSLITVVDMDEKSFDGAVLNTGISVKTEWSSDFTVFVNRTQPVDYLLCGPRHHAVSQSAKETIEINVASGIEFLPVNIVNNISKETIGQYWILNVINNIDALDWEHTKWISDEIPYKETDAHLNIIKPALKLQLVKNQPIFLLRVGERIKSGIYISAILRKKLEANRATLGMDFMPVKTI